MANYPDCALADAKKVSPDAVLPDGGRIEGGDAIAAVLARAFFEEAIIRRMADAIANGGDREKVYALAVELVAHQNE